MRKAAMATQEEEFIVVNAGGKCGYVGCDRPASVKHVADLGWAVKGVPGKGVAFCSLQHLDDFREFKSPDKNDLRFGPLQGRKYEDRR